MTDHAFLQRARLVVGALLCMLVLVPAPTIAQSTFGTLTGTVTDSSGAVVPGATITITRLGTEVVLTTTSDSAGAYQLLNLDPGRYRVVVTLPGFRDESREIDLLARQTVRIDVPLAVAGAQEAVTVIALQPAIETDRATIDSSRSGDDIAKLALNFRATNNTSPIVVATLAQGVQQDRGGSISVAGSLPFMTSFSVDGISTQRVRFGGPSRELFPVGRVDRGIQGELGEQQRRVHAGDRPHDDDQERHEPAARHGLLVQPGQRAERGRPASRRATRTASRSSRRSRPTASASRLAGRSSRNRAFFFGTYEGVRRPNEVTLSPDRAARCLARRRSVERGGADPESVHRSAVYANNQVPVNPVSARAARSVLCAAEPADRRRHQRARTTSSTPRATSRSTASTAASTRRCRPTQKVFGRLTVQERRRHRVPPAALEHEAGRSIPAAPRCVRSPARTTGLRRHRSLNELRGGWSNTVEKDSYTNAPQGRRLVAADRPGRACPGPPATGGFPHHRVRRRVVHLDRRRRSRSTSCQRVVQGRTR